MTFKGYTKSYDIDLIMSTGILNEYEFGAKKALLIKVIPGKKGFKYSLLINVIFY